MGRHQPMSGFIYFIAADALDSVKIGFSVAHPQRRMQELQCGSPARLRLLGFVPGTQTEERDLHKTLAQLRMHGEWFRYADELRFIVSMLDPCSADEPSRRAVFDIALDRIDRFGQAQEDEELDYVEMPLGRPFRGAE